MIKKFTIVVCTYNGELFISKCLDAILSLYSIDKLVDKIIVVDNNSTDATANIIKKYMQYSDLICYEFEARQGLTYAREHAVNASSPWIIYVDDDNVLDKNWLIELEKITMINSKAGVVNGAVVANPTEKLNETECAILSSMYKNLACTHLSEPQEGDILNTTPIGAGMCIRTDALKKIYKMGWLSLEGRKGENLSSGEDTELCQRVFEQGYRYICSYKLKLYHLIPKARLTEEYTEKLLAGLIISRIKYIREQRFGKIKCFFRKCKYLIICYKLKSERIKNFNDERYWHRRIKLLTAELFIKEL